MDPVVFYFIFGLIAGVTGSFIAARLLRVDRLWSLPGKPDPRTLIRPLTQAATVYQVTGPTGLIALAASVDHPLLAYALGRSLTLEDLAAADELAPKLKERGDGLATLVEVITASTAFQSK